MKKVFTARRALCLLLAFTLLFSAMLYAEGEEAYTETSQPIGPGTQYKSAAWVTPNGIFNINMVETLIGTQYIKMETSDSGKAVGTETVSKQAQKKFTKDSRVLGAINGDFFYTNELKGLSSGISIIDGEIKTVLPESIIFGVTDKGNCFIDVLRMDANAQIRDTSYPIAGVNRVRWDNQLILYTPAFASLTNTKGNGTEAVVRGIELPIKGNTTYKGYVHTILKDVKDAQIPEDGVVLSGHGKAAEFLNSLKEGDEVSFSVNLSRNNVKYAVSGNTRLLVNGNLPSYEMSKVTDANKRHPRTAIGIKGGKVIMAAVDGRQQGFSDGMTLYELAEYLKGQGIEYAINLDGGGSTSMIVRTQGNLEPGLVNSPSDGRERNISNSIQIVSYAPQSKPVHVRFTRDTLKIYKNSTYTPSVYAMDKYYNRVDIKPSAIKYTTSKGIGKITGIGTFTAAQKAGKGYIQGSNGITKSRIEVQVYDKAASLKIANDYVSLEPGQKVQLEVKAYDENGQEIVISPSAVKWSVAGNIGTVNKAGVFTAGKNKKDGTITCKLDKVMANVQARVGNMPVVLESFEKADGIEASSIRAEASVKTTVDKEPVKMGKGALQLSYNMVNGQIGTAAAYVNLKSPMKAPGRPLEAGLWAYGDGSAHWLRGVYTNSLGEKKVVNFTNQGGFNWKGWKYVYAEIPKDEQFPIAFEQIYIAEPLEVNKTQGVVYFDNLTALYEEGPDIYNPEVLVLNPAAGTQLDARPSEISVKVRDKGKGIDPASIKLLLDNVQVNVVYNAETGVITHTVDYELFKGEHEVRLSLKDKAGNPLNPELRFSFVINQ